MEVNAAAQNKAAEEKDPESEKPPTLTPPAKKEELALPANKEEPTPAAAAPENEKEEPQATSSSGSDSGPRIRVQAKPADPRPGRDDQPSAQPAEEDPKTAPRVNVENNELRDLYIKYSTKNYYGDAGPGEISLIDCLTELPSLLLTDPGATAFLQDEIRVHVESLRVERMLLVNCSDPGLSRAAATALIEQLRVPPDRRRMLNFERVPADVVPNIFQLMTHRIDPDSDVVVVADAARAERARPFVDSIFSTAGNWTALDRANALRGAGLLLICVAEPEQIGRAVTRNGQSIACWTLSYLQFLLRSRFPDSYAQLEAIISRQRAAGFWASDPADFHKQIASLTNADLMDAVSKGGIAAVRDLDHEISQTDQPLHLAVLYVATFYPGLSPYEFGQVLTKLIGNQKMLEPEIVQQKGKNGMFQPVELKREKELLQVWTERSDTVMRECHLTTSRETKRRVTFADVGRRDQLRRYFEESYGVYVHKQFDAAYEHNLLFESSEQVAQDVIALTIDMACSYPDELGVGWLNQVVLRACSGLADVDPARRSIVYQRIVDLLREMLGDPALDANVTGLLRRLLADAHHGFAFEILKKLRYAPGFDVFQWLRQVVDQGTDEVRDDAYPYLYNELKQPGRTWPALYTFASWLPPGNRQPETYSPSNRMALRLAVEYCLETTMKFNSRHYGVWPSRFPILAVDADNASGHFGLIARLLLHPGLFSVLADRFSPSEVDELIAALFSEWVFILLGPPAPLDDEEIEGTAPEATLYRATAFSAENTLSVLISKIVETTNTSSQKDRQLNLLAYWEGLKQFLTVAPRLLGDTMQHRRNEFAWKRELVRKLITQFRETQRTLRQSPRAQQATA